MSRSYISQWMESATVKVDPFARGGKSRVRTFAADHDFKPEATMTRVGIFLPGSDELFLYGVTPKITSDCQVDRLVDWWESVKERFLHIKTLLINLDNGRPLKKRSLSTGKSRSWPRMWPIRCFIGVSPIL